MERKAFIRMINTIFAAKSGEEMLCTEYFEALPKYADLVAAGEDAAAILPDVKHHMHQCPECEETFLALIETLGKKDS